MKVDIEEWGAYIREQADKNHRTKRGQVLYMLEIAKEHIEQLDQVKAGNTQLHLVRGTDDTD